MGSTAQVMQGPDGRQIEFVDTGPEDGIPVLFIGGGGTSAAVVQVTDFLRTFREDLGLRLISVGRPGYGQSDPAEDWTFDDYATDATAVLDSLDADEVSVVAISAGGPHAAAFAAANPDRVRSIHLAAASALVSHNPNCEDPAALQEAANRTAAFSIDFWSFGEDSPTLLIPGFSSAAANDGARTNAIAGQMGSGAAKLAESTRFVRWTWLMCRT